LRSEMAFYLPVWVYCCHGGVDRLVEIEVRLQ